MLHRAVICFIIICLPTVEYNLTVKGPLRFVAFLHCPLLYLTHFDRDIFSKHYFIYKLQIHDRPFLLRWSNRFEYQYKGLSLYFLLSCQYHSAQQRASEQQHCQLYIHTAPCYVLREDH